MPIPAGADPTIPGAYATIADLTEAMKPKAAPANAAQLLVRASRDVDRALLCQVYDATDPNVVTALREATLEQVAGNLGVGNMTGLGAQAGGFTLGRLSVQPKTPGGEGAPRRIGPLWEQAWNVLQQAQLTGQGPWGY